MPARAGSPVHLVPADDVGRQGYGMTSPIALCGELADVPAALCPLDCQEEHRYCPACVREAVRWGAQPVGG